MLRKSGPEYRKPPSIAARRAISQHNVLGHITLLLRHAARARGSACKRRKGKSPLTPHYCARDLGRRIHLHKLYRQDLTVELHSDHLLLLRWLPSVASISY